MEKHPELYRTILQLVGQMMRTNDIRNTVTMAWMVVGLLVSQTVHLGKWGLQRECTALAASRERQISRWLHNPKIKVDVVYRDFVTAALAPWAEQTAVLALDSSVLWEKYVIIRISLIYRGRALPLAWKVLKQGSASVRFVNCAPVLEEANHLHRHRHCGSQSPPPRRCSLEPWHQLPSDRLALLTQGSRPRRSPLDQPLACP